LITNNVGRGTIFEPVSTEVALTEYALDGRFGGRNSENRKSQSRGGDTPLKNLLQLEEEIPSRVHAGTLPNRLT
jgi:hypothetical protein